ncbi:hypothetical protein HYFRA_00013442 [Hymenoscyphus fraxineus]|uniref:Ecp2 effector protein domain-containing protein n=1 Tax=Hymenoscyphus fraxineus TaxID=746836 RepID=A0A9N9L741_9HELO|nr:hypothetical protein HYFRA_00013442 [Hymenoscyphus fraxineus]
MQIAAILTVIGYLATNVVAQTVFTEAQGIGYPADGFLKDPVTGARSDCTAFVFCGRRTASEPGGAFVIGRNLCDPFFKTTDDPEDVTGFDRVTCTARIGGEAGNHKLVCPML